MKKPVIKVVIPPKQETVAEEMEKVEIVTRICHGFSLNYLRQLEQKIRPKGKNCETIKAD